MTTQSSNIQAIEALAVLDGFQNYYRVRSPIIGYCVCGADKCLFHLFKEHIEKGLCVLCQKEAKVVVVKDNHPYFGMRIFNAYELTCRKCLKYRLKAGWRIYNG